MVWAKKGVNMKKEYEENFKKAIATCLPKDKRRYEFFRDALEFYGEENEIKMTLEEMSELMHVLLKYIRVAEYELSEEGRAKIAKAKASIEEELADIYCTLDQLKIMFGAERIDEIIDEKIERAYKRLEENKKAKK